MEMKRMVNKSIRLSCESREKKGRRLYLILESERKWDNRLAQQQHQHRLRFTKNDSERAKIIDRSSCSARERTIGDFTPFLHIIFLRESKFYIVPRRLLWCWLFSVVVDDDNNSDLETGRNPRTEVEALIVVVVMGMMLVVLTVMIILFSWKSFLFYWKFVMIQEND